MKILSVTAKPFHEDTQTDRKMVKHDETNSRFLCIHLKMVHLHLLSLH